jgi:hypothetical protein
MCGCSHSRLYQTTDPLSKSSNPHETLIVTRSLDSLERMSNRRGERVEVDLVFIIVKFVTRVGELMSLGIIVAFEDDIAFYKDQWNA